MAKRHDRGPQEPFHAEPVLVERGNGRWLVAAGLVLAALVVALVLDRADRAQQAEQAKQAEDLAAAVTGVSRTAPTIGPDTGRLGPGELPAVETFTVPGLPAQLSGTMYAVTDDDSLVELDLVNGNGRRASLGFQAAPWLVSQVVALDDTVLIASRRRVYAVDRATLQVQQELAADRWVAAPPRGDWAALVPFGAGGGAVTLVDGAGVPWPNQPVALPAGVAVHGAVADALIIDHGGGLQLLALDGVAGAELGPGRMLAAGAEVVATMNCRSMNCSVVTATVGGPARSEISGVLPAGPWLFGPGAVFDPSELLLATVAATTGGELQIRVLDTRSPAVRTAPLPPRSAAALPTLAWSTEGSAVLFASADGVALWQPGSSSGDGSSGDASSDGKSPADTVHTMRMPGAVLSLTVTPKPPPPPPIGGPPPSFA
ncbi:MAG: hypothetical protein ACKV2O_13350 [Acidimicrobiales bacterium]